VAKIRRSNGRGRVEVVADVKHKLKTEGKKGRAGSKELIEAKIQRVRGRQVV